MQARFFAKSWRGALMVIAIVAGLGTSPARAADALVSFDTIVVGCVAGAAAGALTVVLPAFVTIGGSGGVIVTSAAVASIAAIGCAVGVISGMAAIGSAVVLDKIHASDAAPPLPAPRS